MNDCDGEEGRRTFLFVLLSRTDMAEECILKIGHGYDVHRLVDNEEDSPIKGVILGGVVIPYEKHLLGHSDADVLTHALMDALLGAAAMGDIGQHYPDTQEQYRGISSLVLLKDVCEKLYDAGYAIGNADVTVILQRPKIAMYIPQIRAKLAQTMDIDEHRLNIKATTEEGLGFTGSGEGAAAHAVALLEEPLRG